MLARLDFEKAFGEKKFSTLREIKTGKIGEYVLCHLLTDIFGE